jgi:hypothetical protein
MKHVSIAYETILMPLLPRRKDGKYRDQSQIRLHENSIIHDRDHGIVVSCYPSPALSYVRALKDIYYSEQFNPVKLSLSLLSQKNLRCRDSGTKLRLSLSWGGCDLY